ncbi:MAG TPA: HDIG domain-containing protein, partial [Anaerolineales bacterium]
LPQDQAILAAELASAFVAPNSLDSESLTASARQKARDSVTPVNRSFITGETVVQHGQVLSAADAEALQKLGLAEPQKKWQDIASDTLLVVVMVAFMALYLRRTPALLQNARSVLIIVFLFLLFLFAARLTISGHSVIPYAFPLAAYGLLVSSLFGVQLALISSLPLAILAAYGMSNSLDLTIFFIMTSLFGVLALRRARRVSSFLRAGLGIALFGSLVILAFRLPLPTTDWVGLVTLIGVSIFNGLAAASLTVLMQFFLAQLLGVVTPLQLMELTRPDHLLLQTLLRDAPGTYQHSLQVANLAEQAAERIGADTLLTRVGALYHDVGKATNPMFFIENQMPGFLNPHDDLDPGASAATIICHVTDGLELGRKNHLPRRLLDFIGEHHGTMLTRYQYVKAVTAAGGDESRVDQEQFRYPGPRPQSRETAILMLADGSEARVRAEHPKDEEELRSLIKGVIDNRLELGQLNDTELTLHDLDVILQSFIATLRGIYHPRVQYPTLEKMATPDEATRPIPFPASRPTSDAPVDSISPGP